jgi:hypothetical protein
MIPVNNWQSKSSARHVSVNLAFLCIIIIGDFKLINIVFYVLTVFISLMFFIL